MCARRGPTASSPIACLRSRRVSSAEWSSICAAADLDLVSLDEVHRRLSEGDFARRFVCLTFDDGYRDTLNAGLSDPQGRRRAVRRLRGDELPDRLGELWWLALEAVIARNGRIVLEIEGPHRSFECAHARGEARALTRNFIGGCAAGRRRPNCGHHTRYCRLLSRRHRGVLQGFVHGLGRDCRACIRSAGDYRCAYGLPSDAGEVPGGSRALGNGSEPLGDRSRALVARPQHLAYPVGDPTSAGPREFKIAAELGFKTAVTTRPGVLFAGHREHLTALPRISLNGEYQRLRYVRVLLSGAGTAMWNGFRRNQEAGVRGQVSGSHAA